jgi:hypothetical protein
MFVETSACHDDGLPFLTHLTGCCRGQAKIQVITVSCLIDIKFFADMPLDISMSTVMFVKIGIATSA